MNRVLAVDCDGVLLDWDGGFAPFASERLGRPIVGRPQDWNMDTWLGAPALPLIAEFNASGEFGQLCPTKGAEQALPALAKDGWTFAVVTSCSNDPTTFARRVLNLRMIFGDVFHSIQCLPLGVSKAPALARLPGPTFWVEDNYKNACLGKIACQYDPIVIRQPWNEAFEEADDLCTWVDDWHQIAGLIQRWK